MLFLVSGKDIINWFYVCFQSILSYNGGAVVAMKGENCVAIAADRRFGIQAQTLAFDFDVSFLIVIIKQI